MSELRFEGRVALVTGAGRGIGRAHAMLLADRGAKVVVNDLGCATDGSGVSRGPADDVVAEIEAAGGTAVADANTVSTEEGAAAMVAGALDAFGRLDILIHNAGLGMRAEPEAMIDVHLWAALWLTEAAWAPMAQQRYGKILLTSSGAGLFGQLQGPEFSSMLSYGAAKMGVIGLMRNLAIRGSTLGITCNAVAPGALTRMVQEEIDFLVPEGVRPDMSNLKAEHVASVAAWLVHEDCPATGEILSAYAGGVSRVFVGATPGILDHALTPEVVRDSFERICDEDGYVVPANSSECPIQQALLPR